MYRGACRLGLERVSVVQADPHRIWNLPWQALMKVSFRDVWEVLHDCFCRNASVDRGSWGVGGPWGWGGLGCDALVMMLSRDCGHHSLVNRATQYHKLTSILVPLSGSFLACRQKKVAMDENVCCGLETKGGIGPNTRPDVGQAIVSLALHVQFWQQLDATARCFFVGLRTLVPPTDPYSHLMSMSIILSAGWLLGCLTELSHIRSRAILDIRK